MSISLPSSFFLLLNPNVRQGVQLRLFLDILLALLNFRLRTKNFNFFTLLVKTMYSKKLKPKKSWAPLNFRFSCQIKKYVIHQFSDVSETRNFYKTQKSRKT